MSYWEQKMQNENNGLNELDAVSDFLNLRYHQKNSLSNFIKNKKNNPNEKEKIITKQLINQLNINFNEGHTVYYTNNKEIINNISRLTELNWLTIWDKQENINTPMVAKITKNQDLILWLQRLWFAEKQFCERIMQISNTNLEKFETVYNHNVNNLISPNTLQQQAIKKACRFAFSIITGGPGTGKTFTVANLVMQLLSAHQEKQRVDKNLPPLAIALTAPTGKASQRMQESLNKNLQSVNLNLDNAKTLHRLLGIGQDGLPRYHLNNPLPDDLVIVDEASMLGLELATMLVNAIKPNGRLILLGDANQLSAVDAGSVLADLCRVPALADYRTNLIESKRFSNQSKIGKVALIIQTAMADNSPAVINHCLVEITPAQFLKKSFNDEKIAWIKKYHANIYEVLAKPYHAFFDLIKQWYKMPVDITLAENRQRLFEVFDSYRILSAGHHGKLGTMIINEKIQEIFFRQTNLDKKFGYFYHGMPILIKNNDYQLGLFNGDIGICLSCVMGMVVCFVDKVIPMNRVSIDLVDIAYAMSIHKSQGSEFKQVAVCLDNSHERLLSQELIYTAITRSKEEVLMISSQTALNMALNQKVLRYTGIDTFF